MATHQTIGVDYNNGDPKYWSGVVDGNKQANDLHNEFRAARKGDWKIYAGMIALLTLVSCATGYSLHR